MRRSGGSDWAAKTLYQTSRNQASQDQTEPPSLSLSSLYG
jgi:hypothetical protein